MFMKIFRTKSYVENQHCTRSPIMSKSDILWSNPGTLGRTFPQPTLLLLLLLLLAPLF